MDKEQFTRDLKSLQDKFESLKPELEVTLKDPASGTEGYVVVWNTDISLSGGLGPVGKGGTRISHNLTLSEIKMLARKMALKNAAAGLPLGGAKSGLKIDPCDRDLEKKFKAFVHLCKPYLLEEGGIFGGLGWDLGVRSEMAKWVIEELGSSKSFTGKPVDLGGTAYDIEGIAGLGVATAANIALEMDGISVNGATFAVQGIGAMGSAVIKYFSEYDTRLYAVSDILLGGTWILEGNASKELLDSLAKSDIEKSKGLLQHSHYKFIPDDTHIALFQNVDVTFPCAIQDQITSKNVDNIKSKYWVEGAISPCRHGMHKIMQKRGITVVPDIIANAGGILSAYVEMTSNVSIEENIKTHANVYTAKQITRERISSNTKHLLELMKKYDASADEVSEYIALSNIFAKN